jgi:hypothetical protein
LAAVAKRQKQARQARLDERAAQIRAQVDAERRRTYIVIAVFAVLIVGGFGALYFLTNPPNLGGTSSKPGTGKPVAAATAIPDEGRSHVTRPQRVTYAHQPPSSGNHYNDAQAPRPWGANHDALLPEEYVHNLEHGGIVLVYKCSGTACDDYYAQSQALFAALPKDPKYAEVKFLSTPYQSMTPGFAMLSWDNEQDFTGFPTTADATAFYNQFVNTGPEAVP